jgi:hypothetical protein
MAETFNRRNEICSNPVDQQGVDQLSNMLRHEFLDKPLPDRKFGTNNITADNGNVDLSTFYKADGGIGLFGMSATVHCPQEDTYVQVSLNPTGKLSEIDVAQNGKWVLQLPVDKNQK